MDVRLLSCIVALGCTSTKGEANPVISEGLTNWVAEFLDDCSKYKVDCSSYGNLEHIKYVDKIGGTAIGQCSIDWNGDSRIIIKTGMNPIATRSVVYHELGHCVLARSHDVNSITIMNTHLTPPQSEKQWQRMIKDMFSMRDPVVGTVINRGVQGVKID